MESLDCNELAPAQSETLSSCYLRLRKPLLRFIAHVMGDHRAAQDVVQDAFFQLSIHVCSGRFWPDEGEAGAEANLRRVHAWLHLTALRNALSELRSTRRRHGREEQYQGEAPWTTDPRQDEESLEIQDRVRQTILNLPDSYRLPIEMAYEGCPVAQIAGTLGLTRHTAEMRLLRARAAFRKLYADEDGA